MGGFFFLQVCVHVWLVVSRQVERQSSRDPRRTHSKFGPYVLVFSRCSKGWRHEFQFGAQERPRKAQKAEMRHFVSLYFATCRVARVAFARAPCAPFFACGLCENLVFFFICGSHVFAASPPPHGWLRACVCQVFAHDHVAVFFSSGGIVFSPSRWDFTFQRACGWSLVRVMSSDPLAM